jgi:hypothetical protein
MAGSLLCRAGLEYVPSNSLFPAHQNKETEEETKFTEGKAHV